MLPLNQVTLSIVSFVIPSLQKYCAYVSLTTLYKEYSLVTGLSYDAWGF